MSGGRGVARRCAIVVMACVAAAGPALAFASLGLSPLSRLERGRWSIVHIDGGERHSLCLGDPVQLVRLDHRTQACSQALISADSGGVVVQLSCPRRGSSHTSVRVETPRLARIDTQGLIDGRPFAYRAEARRVGPC